MFTSFSTALSALNATSTAIDVVGNNLANMNSTGFKESDMSFSDLVTQSLGAGLGSTQVGFGTATPLTVANFSQGAIQTTPDGLLNGAISGEGFFLVTDPTTGNTEYTRAGDFQTDASGQLMTANGDYVQGWTADGTGAIDTNSAVSNIIVPVGTLQPPVATTTMTASANLDSSATVGTNFSDTVTVYDSLGTSHQLTLTYTEQSPNNWSYVATLPPADLTDPTTTQIGSGNVVFTPNGNLDFTQTPTPVQFILPQFADGATPGGTITWNLTGANGAGNITQYDQPSASSSSSQDGQAAAQLVNVGLGDGGTILAQYSDGQQVTVARVALAAITNPDSLVAVGANNYMLSEASAVPNIGVSGTGGRGTIQGASLEASNVDIATEFTNLIVYQRGYEANGKVVSTADTLSQDTINLIQG